MRNWSVYLKFEPPGWLILKSLGLLALFFLTVSLVISIQSNDPNKISRFVSEEEMEKAFRKAARNEEVAEEQAEAKRFRENHLWTKASAYVRNTYNDGTWYIFLYDHSRCPRPGVVYAIMKTERKLGLPTRSGYIGKDCTFHFLDKDGEICGYYRTDC